MNIENNMAGIFISQNNQDLCISQRIDNDVWFGSNDCEITLDLYKYSKDIKEHRIYNIFEELVKLIIGRYILNEDYSKNNYMLPSDFVDLKNKVIIYHSDTGEGILKIFVDCENNKIKIVVSDVVRIRTSGSNYGSYYQEFLKFYRELLIYSNNLKNININNKILKR